MRCAAIRNWQAERERGLIPPGPHIRLEVTPQQFVALGWCVRRVLQQAVAATEAQPDPVQRGILAGGLPVLHSLLRLLSR